jgi:acyl carrier protein
MTGQAFAEVRRLLIKKLGVPANKVTRNAQLVHDLDVDGADASRLLRELHVTFGTDFSPLESHRLEFFTSGAVSPRLLLLCIPLIIIGSGAAGMLVAALDWPELITIPLAVLFSIGLIWLFGRWVGKPRRSLTVGGLAEIVEAGAWPADPAKVR